MKIMCPPGYHHNVTCAHDVNGIYIHIYIYIYIYIYKYIIYIHKQTTKVR